MREMVFDTTWKTPPPKSVACSDRTRSDSGPQKKIKHRTREQGAKNKGANLVVDEVAIVKLDGGRRCHVHDSASGTGYQQKSQQVWKLESKRGTWAKIPVAVRFEVPVADVRLKVNTQHAQTETYTNTRTHKNKETNTGEGKGLTQTER